MKHKELPESVKKEIEKIEKWEQLPKEIKDKIIADRLAEFESGDS